MNTNMLMITRTILSNVLVLFVFSASLLAQDTNAARRLRAQGKQFEEEVIIISKGVYTSVGASVSNVSMIVGDDGLIIIDTGMTTDAAEKILRRQFLSFVPQPLRDSRNPVPRCEVLGR